MIGATKAAGDDLGARAEIVHVLGTAEGTPWILVGGRPPRHQGQLAVVRVGVVQGGMNGDEIIGPKVVARAHDQPRGIERAHELLIRPDLPVGIAPRLVADHPGDDRGVVPELRDPARGVGEHVAVKLLPLFGRELEIQIVVGHRKFGEQHHPMRVSDVGPVGRRWQGVGAKAVEVHLARLVDDVALGVTKLAPPGPFVNEIRPPQPEGSLVHQDMPALHPEGAHAEMKTRTIQRLPARRRLKLGEIQVGRLGAPPPQPAHGHDDLDGPGGHPDVDLAHAGRGRRAVAVLVRGLRPDTDPRAGTRWPIAKAVDDHAKPRATAFRIGHDEDPFKIQAVVELDPDVVEDGGRPRTPE